MWVWEKTPLECQIPGWGAMVLNRLSAHLSSFIRHTFCHSTQYTQAKMQIQTHTHGEKGAWVTHHWGRVLTEKYKGPMTPCPSMGPCRHAHTFDLFLLDISFSHTHKLPYRQVRIILSHLLALDHLIYCSGDLSRTTSQPESSWRDSSPQQQSAGQSR